MELINEKIFPGPSLTPAPSIQALIFDFGGVLLRIDPDLTRAAFLSLGLKKPGSAEEKEAFTSLFSRLETGATSPQEFRDGLRPFFTGPVTDDQLDEAWNALLLDFPPERIRLLESLRQHYRIFLLSNSNAIHYDCYVSRFRERFGYRDFDALFEKAWFSHRLGMKKPAPEIFHRVTAEAGLDPASTLFIDDTLEHVLGARQAGLHALHLDLAAGNDITGFFRE